MDQHVVYCFLGMAEAEDQKVFLWPQWEQCFRLLDPFLAPFAKTSLIKSNQAYETPLKPLKTDPPGMRRVTFKPVPLGKLRWTYEDNARWSQKLLEKGEHPIRLLDTQILSSNSRAKAPELQVCIFNRDSVPGAAYNQVVTLSVTERVFHDHPADHWTGLVDNLTRIVRAGRIGRTVRPWWLERLRGNVTEGSSVAGAHFTKRYDSLELDDSWQTWDYLK